MNRRVFCSALAAWACSGGAAPRKRRRRRVRPSEPASLDGAIVDRISPYAYNSIRSPLAVYGDVLVDSMRGKLRIWDLQLMKLLATRDLSHVSYCFLQDGTLAVLALPPESHHLIVHRVDVTTGKLRSLHGPRAYWSSGPPVLLPARTPSDYYGVRASARELVVFRAAKGRVVEDPSLALPEETALYYGIGDGRVVLVRDDVHLLEAGKPTRTFSLPGRSPCYLAAATGDRCWYTFASDHGERIDSLALAPVTSPANDEQRIVFGPHEHAVRIGSDGDAVAVLLFSIDIKATTFDEGFHWWVVLIGEDGKERWRVPVPQEYAKQFSFRLNTQAFVAVSAHRVILSGPDDTYLAWDRATARSISWPADTHG